MRWLGVVGACFASGEVLHPTAQKHQKKTNEERGCVPVVFHEWNTDQGRDYAPYTEKQRVE